MPLSEPKATDRILSASDSLPSAHFGEQSHQDLGIAQHREYGRTNGNMSGNVDESVQDGSLLMVCDELARRLKLFLDSEQHSEMLKAVQSQTKIALGVIGEALERYSLEEISISYNGGKDCLVLLVLFLASLSPSVPLSKSHKPRKLPHAVQSVYIVSAHPFQEVDDFVSQSITTYVLDLARYSMAMKEGFGLYLEEKKATGRDIKAIFVGTRRTDPHGALLTHFDITDGGWPRFMRVHPVIDWHYAEIWAFIRHLEIPYCSLYNMGYTSLGGTTDTHPNPALEAESDVKGETTHRPAYELVEDEAERLGRDF